MRAVGVYCVRVRLFVAGRRHGTVELGGSHGRDTAPRRVVLVAAPSVKYDTEGLGGVGAEGEERVPGTFFGGERALASLEYDLCVPPRL